MHFFGRPSCGQFSPQLSALAFLLVIGMKSSITKGSVFESRKCGYFEVTGYIPSRDVYTVVFLDTGTKVEAQWSQIKSRCIKDRMRPSVCGVGFIGIGEYKTSKNGKKTTAYTRWSRMIERCYSERVQLSYPSYIGCTVDDEWHNFQNFAEWHKENFPTDSDGRYELDKDSLCPGNKVYSKTTCVYLKKAANLSEVSSRPTSFEGDVVSFFYGDGYRLNIKESHIDDFCSYNSFCKKKLLKLYNGEIDEYKGLRIKP